MVCDIIASVRSSLILTWVTYVSCPDLFTHLYIVNEISIYENFQFRISFMTYCYLTLPIYIHTPEGYSFSRKLYGINVRNLSTPPGTWYFLNSQRHDRRVLWAEDAIRHPPKVVLVENVFLIPNPNHYPNTKPNPKPNPKPNFGYQ